MPPILSGAPTVGSARSIGGMAARTAAVASDLGDGNNVDDVKHGVSSSGVPTETESSGKKGGKLMSGIKGLAGRMRKGSGNSSTRNYVGIHSTTLLYYYSMLLKC